MNEINLEDLRVGKEYVYDYHGGQSRRIQVIENLSEKGMNIFKVKFTNTGEVFTLVDNPAVFVLRKWRILEDE